MAGFRTFVSVEPDLSLGDVWRGVNDGGADKGGGCSSSSIKSGVTAATYTRHCRSVPESVTLTRGGRG